MPSPIYPYMINLVVSPGEFMNVLVQEQEALNNQIFYVAKSTILTPL